MLLRAGLIYILSVLTVLLGGLAAWQHLDISLRDESAAALNNRIKSLQIDLDAVGRREDSALRRALVAEDSLLRNATYSSSDVIRLNEARETLADAIRDKAAAEAARSRLEADLAQAEKERDQIRAERDDIQRAADEARMAADKALQDADTARQELSDLKKAGATARHAEVPQKSTVSTEAVVATPAAPSLNVQAPSVAAAPDETIRPATESATADRTAEQEDKKSALVPNAVTIEPVPAPKSEKRAEKPAASKRAVIKSEPRRPNAKPATASSSAAKKPPKQAKKDEPFFPF